MQPDASLTPLAFAAVGTPVATLVWLGIGIMILALAGFYVVSVLRRQLNVPDEPEKHAAGFTLSELRQLHGSGQLTKDEFEKAKAKIVERMRPERNAGPGPDEPGKSRRRMD